MLLVTHTLTGVAIVSNIDTPTLSLPLAVIAHFAIDLLPHRDYFSFSKFPTFPREKKVKILKMVGLDFFVSVFLGLFLAFWALPEINKAKIIILGAFLTNLPDGLEFPYLLGVSYPGLRSIMRVQSRLQTRTGAKASFLIQILIATACFFASL